MAFNLLKSASINKPYCSFSELPVGEYIIAEFALVDTKFGERLRVDLGEKYVYLPMRYAVKMTNDLVAELNETPMVMIYMGKNPKKHNKIILDFKPLDLSSLATDALNECA